MSALAASVTLITYRYLTSAGEKYVTISARGYQPQCLILRGPGISIHVFVHSLFHPDRTAILVLFYTSLSLTHRTRYEGLEFNELEKLACGAQRSHFLVS